MSKLFCVTPELRLLEKQMQEPPGYRPRGHGIPRNKEMGWKNRDDYSEVVDYIINCMKLEQLKKRIEEIFDGENKKMIFKDGKHRNEFLSLLSGKRSESLHHMSNYAAAVFLLSADEKLWKIVRKNVLDSDIYFAQVELGGVSLEQYILFHAAKDVYMGTQHIRLSELTDRELISDEILRLIVNAFVIGKCGVEMVAQEAWNAD